MKKKDVENRDELIDVIETEFISKKPERRSRIAPEMSRSVSMLKKSSRSRYSTQLTASLSGVLRTHKMTSDVLVLGASSSGKTLLIRRLQSTFMDNHSMTLLSRP